MSQDAGNAGTTETQETVGAGVEVRSRVGAHATHCCKVHGCKYDDATCPVFTGPLQGIVCELCYEADQTIKEMLPRGVAAYNSLMTLWSNDTILNMTPAQVEMLVDTILRAVIL